MKISELERIIQVVKEDNKSLEIKVQKWKLEAERCKTRAIEYDRVIRNILVCLEEVKSGFNG
jgi:hypothetical protein